MSNSFLTDYMIRCGTQYSLAGVVDAFARLLDGGSARTAQDELKARFAEKGIEGDELANAVLAVLVGSTVEMSEGSSVLVVTIIVKRVAD